ncbi:MAG TPA: ribulokinase, partial [Rikenellaceae bacterium]|nr:ribulokinase [Rikenellaceae bacterium]
NISLSSPISTGYLNGRRSPAPDSSLTCTITGLTLGTSTAEIYYALAESAAFGAKAAIDHLMNNGVLIERLVAIGGIAFKSPFIMQLMADANMKKIEVLDCKQSCALGAAVNASVVAGLYPDVPAAQKALCPPSVLSYIPSPERHEMLERRYQKYLELSKLK